MRVMFLIKGIIVAKIHDNRQAGLNLYSSLRLTVYILNIRTDKPYHAQSDQDEHCICYIVCGSTSRDFQEGLDVGDAGMRFL